MVTVSCQFAKATSVGLRHSFGLDYVSSALDVFRLHSGANKDGAPIKPFFAFCAPRDLPYGVATEIFVRYLTSHPEARNHVGTWLVSAATAETFPCKAK
ncbi:Rap1a/Tai family immunity protein [Bradyrhizobium sp. CCBAU 051011]|uniref:Rap1a/Tai family immunity protein n=1 Tax=Bradyrhizobium sp. CCBAU 051011 TaxID=858422 RepID=UPI00137B31BC|nr:Rap1a/Tai family immunity protein [Bradyrhizobium sp. CCBAU 051011]